MTRIFIKLYGGILASFLLILFVSYLFFIAINHSRYGQYQLDVSHGVLSGLGQQLDQLHAEKRKKRILDLNQQFSINVFLFRPAELSLGRRRQARLMAGLPVRAKRIVGGKARVYLFYYMPESSLYIGLEAEHVLRNLPNLTIHLISQQKLENSSQDLEKTLDHLARIFKYPVRASNLEQLALNNEQLSRITTGGVISRLVDSSGSMEFITNFLNADQYVSIGPIKRFQRYPLHLMAMILALDLLLLGLVAYALVRPIEQRLAGLAMAAKQIKKGDLHVRAKVDSNDGIGALAAAFNAMAEHIQMLLDMQSEMIRAVSHELRTPVARLRFSLQLIEDAENVEERMPLYSSMDDDIQELDELIDEILTYARMEHSAPELNFTLLDVDSVMTRVLSEMNLTAKKANVHVEHVPESLPQRHRLVEGEERYIHRVIQNFVGNAIRYAKRQVRMSFLIDGIKCRIVVEDDGPGIPKEEWEKVFTPFSRLDTSRNKASGGYGLGLSIVQRIASWHHGKVFVEESSFGGAMFVMEWPVRQPDPMMAAIAASQQELPPL